MNHRFISFLWGSLLLLTLPACNVNVQEGGSSGPGYVNLDSGAVVTTHSETHSESHSTTHTTTTVGKQQTFDQLVEQWAMELFPDYKTVEMDPLEAYPKYKGAQTTRFRRLRIKSPISNHYGKAVYPRILMKVYRFAAPSALTHDVEQWLGSLGSEKQDIQLGQAAQSLKSPPLLCAVVGSDFLVVQWACVYDGKEWMANMELFFSKMEDYGASYAFEIQCKGGELIYRIGGGS